ncbi:MAG: protein sphX [Bacteroidota bacterium]|nr:protein sphX [Bacteroidota bacterium]
MKKTKIIGWIAAVIIGFTACKNSSTTDTGSAEKEKGEVKIDGSSTVYPITEAIAEEYRKEQPDVKVTAGESGTGGGMKKFTVGEIDICDASRTIKPAEDSLAKANKIDYVELKIAFDGLCIVVNPANKFLDNITTEELKKLWEPEAQGKVKKWNQVNAAWSAEEVHLFGPGTASGTFDYFTEEIVGAKGKSRGDYTASEDDNVLVQGVAGDKNALGYFGLAYFENNKDKLKNVKVNGIAPSKETVMNGTYKPLSRPLFIYVNKASFAKPGVKAFVKYYIDNVKSIVGDVGYIPLHDDEYAKTQKVFEDATK